MAPMAFRHALLGVLLLLAGVALAAPASALANPAPLVCFDNQVVDPATNSNDDLGHFCYDVMGFAVGECSLAMLLDDLHNL
jgi:hypothetical protein